MLSRTSDSRPLEFPSGGRCGLIRGGSGAISVSDEEVLLASHRPKRRAGRKKFKETRHPVYRGVRKRNSDKWVCEVREPNKKTRIWLGTFPTADMAARAHDVAAMALRGRSACLNFADSAWRLRVPESADAKDIQRAAAEAAEMFKPVETEEICSNEMRTEEITLTSPDTSHTTPTTTSLFFGNEEEEEEAESAFGMPSRFKDMALLSPTHLEGGIYWDDMETDADMALWSHSI